MRKILVFRVAQISCPHILEAPLVEECFSWFELSSFVPTKGNFNVQESIYILDSSLPPTLWQQFEERPSVTLNTAVPPCAKSRPRNGYKRGIGPAYTEP